MAINKLYPPIIGTTLPAFYQDDDDNLIVRVPFEHNKAVSSTDYDAMILRLKTVQNDFTAILAKNENTSSFSSGGEVTFTIPFSAYTESDQQWYVNVGQYYKLQIAYRQKSTKMTGYYSTVGISKFSVMPTVTIDGLSETEENEHLYTYKGIYSQKAYDDDGGVIYGDMTEKVYNYKFIIKNKSTDEIIEDTGWLLHDSSTDEDSYESFDTFKYTGELEEDSTIQYCVDTNTDILANSPEYTIKSQTYTQFGSTKVSLCFDDGYVKVEADIDKESALKYVIARTHNGETVRLCEIDKNYDYYIDNTVEQGETYSYAIYTVDSSERVIISTIPAVIKVDYEDMFLSDASGRQLKLRYNPNVTQYKTTILETKMDTIGGQYPIFLRNGNVKYKELPITGLISYHIDENKMFYPVEAETEYYRSDTTNTQEITTLDIATITSSERKFREEVNEWLINGEPKLFRSPTEGIMVVRTMNTSFAPYNNTQRLVYTMSCSAVEIANHDDNALSEYGFYELGGRTNA